MCAHEGVDKPTMKALCLAGCLKRNRVLLDAGSTKIVGETADCEHQRVVMERTLRCDLAALLIDDGRYLHLAPFSVEVDHLSKAEAEMMPVRLRQIIELVHTQIHASGRDLVQQRLPQVRTALVDQLDLRPAAFAKTVAEPGGELQASRPSADDEDLLQRPVVSGGSTTVHCPTLPASRSLAGLRLPSLHPSPPRRPHSLRPRARCAPCCADHALRLAPCRPEPEECAG